MGDPKHYIRQGGINDDNFLYLTKKICHHLDNINESVSNINSSEEDEIEDLKQSVGDLNSDIKDLQNQIDNIKRIKKVSYTLIIPVVPEFSHTSTSIDFDYVDNTNKDNLININLGFDEATYTESGEEVKKFEEKIFPHIFFDDTSYFLTIYFNTDIEENIRLVFTATYWYRD